LFEQRRCFSEREVSENRNGEAIFEKSFERGSNGVNKLSQAKLSLLPGA